MKLSKPQILKVVKSGRFLSSFLGALEGQLMKAVMPLAKNVPLRELTATAVTADAGNNLGMTRLVTSNEELRLSCKGSKIS